MVQWPLFSTFVHKRLYSLGTFKDNVDWLDLPYIQAKESPFDRFGGKITDMDTS